MNITKDTNPNNLNQTQINQLMVLFPPPATSTTTTTRAPGQR